VFSGEARLWKLWWLGCIPVAVLATGFTISAELLRVEGRHAWGDFFDVLKLMVYAAWFAALWKGARNAGSPVAKNATRLAVAAGVVTAALTV
jgi:hypothetical protein